MILDILLIIILVLAIIKGFQRGLVVGLFSFIAVIIGLAAAIKLSAIVAVRLGESTRISTQWLPVISFLLVFIGIVLLIRLGARLIQKTVELTMLGWVNRLGGIILYVAIYLMVFSVILFYADQLHLLQPATIDQSSTYGYIKPLGPKVISAFGSFIPFFKDMFGQLQSFFGNVADNFNGKQ
ncbi:MAG: CvpA family protein [Chitinophagaceae bacterium]|nr:MAG: CvpA family protein [Chitinophagaceae bacterium]